VVSEAKRTKLSSDGVRLFENRWIEPLRVIFVAAGLRNAFSFWSMVPEIGGPYGPSLEDVKICRSSAPAQTKDPRRSDSD